MYVWHPTFNESDRNTAKRPRWILAGHPSFLLDVVISVSLFVALGLSRSVVDEVLLKYVATGLVKRLLFPMLLSIWNDINGCILIKLISLTYFPWCTSRPCPFWGVSPHHCWSHRIWSVFYHVKCTEWPLLKPMHHDKIHTTYLLPKLQSAPSSSLRCFAT